MRLQINEWIEDAENAVLEERATVAAFQIHLGAENVSAHEEDGIKYDQLVGSVYGFADGIVHDWWRIFGSRGEPIMLRQYRSGYILPDLYLSIDGQQARIWTNAYTHENPLVHFSSCAPVTCTRADIEQAFEGMIDILIARLDAKGLQATSLHQCWALVKASRADPEEAKFCEAAGALYLDPYILSDSDAKLILKSAS